jgi:hypothetical protein
MTQFTKFTNLPIYSDPERTAITNTLIADIPEYVIRDDEGNLVSMSYADIHVLCTERILEDSCTLYIVEQEDHGWSIQHFNPNTGIRITERSNGDWDKYILVNKEGQEYFEVLEECTPGHSHKHYIPLGTEFDRELHFDSVSQKYVFNVTSFMTDKMRSISKHFHSPEVVEDYESAYFSGKKEEVVNGINQLIARLIEIRQQINGHTTE